MLGRIFKNIAKVCTAAVVVAIVVDSISGPVQQHYRQYTKASVPRPGTQEYSDIVANARQKILDAD